MLMPRLPVVICFVCISFTVKHNNQILKASYAQDQQAHQAQKKVMEIRTREEQTNDWKGVANTLIVDSTEKDTEKACPPIHLLHDGFVGKVKMLKKPKTELGKLMGLHGEGSNSGKSIVDGTSVKVE